MKKLLRLLLAAAILPVCLARGEEPPKEPDDPPYSMPTEEIYSDDVLKTKFEYRKTVPYGDPTLAVLIPSRTTWKWVTVAHPNKIDTERMVPLARVEVPDDPEVAVEMKYIVLLREVNLTDWVDFFMVSQGMHVVHAQGGVYHGRPTIDTLCEFKVPDGRIFVARVAFFKNANRIYVTSGSCPQAKYETYAEEFGLAVTSATPVALSQEEFAEPVMEYRFPVGKKYSFTYPASWAVRDLSELPTGVSAVDLFHEKPATPVGLIKVRVFNRERVEGMTLDTVTWTVFEELKSASGELRVEEKLDEKEAATSLFPQTGKMVVYKADLGGSPIEIHEAVFANDSSFFGVYLITPPSWRAPRLYMVNRRAWEIVQMRIRDGA